MATKERVNMNGQMTLFEIGLEKSWKYEEDTGTVMAKCPECEGRMIINFYQYHNPYKYCPYCGIRLMEGPIERKRREVYG